MRSLSLPLAAALALSVQARHVFIPKTAAGEDTSRELEALCYKPEQRGTFGLRRVPVYQHPTGGCPAALQYDGWLVSAHVDNEEALYSLMPAGVDAAILGRDYNFEREVQRLVDIANGDNKLIIQDTDHNSARNVVRLVYSNSDGALVALQPGNRAIQRFDFAAHQVPYISRVAFGEQLSKLGDNEAQIEHLTNVLDELTFDEDVATIVQSITSKSIRADVEYLSGEDKDSPIWSRHSFSDGALVAADWLLYKFEKAGGKCHLWNWGEGFAPDVVCHFETAEGTDPAAPAYILGAHYDSRGSFGSTRAPGADDDGSGTSQILAIAKALGDNNVKLRAPLHIVAFSGEEQGLLGSRAYAAKLASENVPVALMIQADMLAYHKPGEPPQLGLPASIHTPVASYLVGNVSTLYSPELVVGTTRACCSDHQSFLSSGFVATQVFERAGPIADPMYHNSGDLVGREGYDVDQIRSIAKVTLATVLHGAGFEIVA